MKILLTLLCVAAVAAPASAQIRPPARPATTAPSISLRPFVVVAGERFTATKTFGTVFGQAVQPLWGGGLQVAFRRGFYFDLTASRFQKTGQRAFFLDGQRYPLGIPLRVTLTPFEFTAGGRFRMAARVFAYAGVGAGSYAYTEKSDDSTDINETFDARHAGYLVVGGVEFRVSRWVAVSGDAQYTHVTGIIGSGGISKEAGESDLGGPAGRFRMIIGR